MAAEASSKNNVFQPDSDVHITFEDQQKINLFARHNAKYEDYKAEIQAKTNELKNLDDAEDELMLRSDDDVEGLVPILTGDNFLYMTTDQAVETLKKSREKIDKEIKKMQEAMEVLKENMSSLKTQLYGKFGNHINLEGEE